MLWHCRFLRAVCTSTCQKWFKCGQWCLQAQEPRLPGPPQPCLARLLCSTWHGSLVLLVGTCPKTIIPWLKRCWCWSCVEPCSTETGTHCALVPSVCAPHKHPGNPAGHWQTFFSLFLSSACFWVAPDLLSQPYGMGSRNKDQGRHQEVSRGNKSMWSLWLHELLYWQQKVGRLWWEMGEVLEVLRDFQVEGGSWEVTPGAV